MWTFPRASEDGAGLVLPSAGSPRQRRSPAVAALHTGGLRAGCCATARRALRRLRGAAPGCAR